MDKLVRPTLYWAGDYLSMLGLKLIHVIKRGTCSSANCHLPEEGCCWGFRLYNSRLCFYQMRSAWSMDQGSNKNHSPINNFTPTVTKFCVMWEGQALPHDTKFGNCRDKIVDSRAFLSWSLIHGSSWSRLIKAEPGFRGLIQYKDAILPSYQCSNSYCGDKTILHISIMGFPVLVRSHLYIESVSRLPDGISTPD